jgi:predicted nucleotidyltransferase component of viral defense system
MIKPWLEEYQPKTHAETEQALREIMQEIALAGLERSGFFEKAAFYGGSALRLFHGLDRFSEDLDFSLLEVNPHFSFKPYLTGMLNEFNALGLTVTIQEKAKTKQTKIESAFLKADTVWKELVLEDSGLNMRPTIKIKLEVDTHPPLGFSTEEKLLLRPFSFYVKCFALPDLFAGKLHALLFRQRKQRVKGRDWYDMEWYIKKGVPVNFQHLVVRAKNSGDWKEETMTHDHLMTLLQNKISTVSFSRVLDDIMRFVRDDKQLKIWSADYFKDLVPKIIFK